MGQFPFSQRPLGKILSLDNHTLDAAVEPGPGRQPRIRVLEGERFEAGTDLHFSGVQDE